MVYVSDMLANILTEMLMGSALLLVPHAFTSKHIYYYCNFAGAGVWLQPCWSRLGSDWVFLLILGIIMALISSVLDLAIAKCETGMMK